MPPRDTRTVSDVKRERRRKPPPKVTPQGKALAATTSLFVPPALVAPPRPVNPDQDKVPVPFPVKATAKERREAREVAEKLVTKTRADNALVAPVSMPARIGLRRTETPTEKKVRTGTVPDVKAPTMLGDVIAEGVGVLATSAVKAVLEPWDPKGRASRPGVGALESLAGAPFKSQAILGTGIFRELVVGPDLMAAAAGEEHSRAGLYFDLAMLPLAVVGRPIKGVRAAAAAGKASARGATVKGAAKTAADVYRGPSLLQQRKAAREAAKLRKAATESAVAMVAVSPAHRVALKAVVAAEEAVNAKAAQIKAKKLRPEQAEAAEKELESLKAARAAATNEADFQYVYAGRDYKPLTPDDPRYAARDELARVLHKQLKGRSGALPPGMTPAKIRDNMTFLEEMADRGAESREWYENSARAILELTQGDAVNAERFAQLIAIYSPQQPIVGNTSLALRAWNEFQVNGRVGTGQDWQMVAAEKVLKGAGDWEGRKTNNFYVNFLEDIDRDKFNDMVRRGEIRPDGVTIDMWMARVFGYTTDAVSEGRYDFMEPIVRHLASERGWKPKHVQAAIWTAMKDASPSDVSANIDFASGIIRHYGQFNYEAAPGAASSFGEIYRSWDPETRRQFTYASALLVDDFLRRIGFLGQESRFGPGVYDGPNGLEFNPGASAQFATSAAPRELKPEMLPEVEQMFSGWQGAAELALKKGYMVHPTERLRVIRAAAAIGRALEQDSVAWVRPSVSRSPGHADTAVVSLGRAGTDEEAQALEAALNPSGFRVAIMTSADGFVLRNVSDEVPNIAKRNSETGFDELVDQAVETAFPGDIPVALRAYASDGGLVESGDYGRYLEIAGDGGGSGEGLRFLEAADRLSREAAELRDRFTVLAGRAGRAASGVDPQARLAELERFLKPYVQSAYRLVRDADPSSTIGRDRRPRRVASDADRAKTQAIGVGDPIEEMLAPVTPRHGPTEDQRRAEHIVYEAAKQSDTPVARRIVEAFDEIDEINAAENARVEAQFMDLPTPYETAKTREAESWLGSLKQQLADERGSISLEREARGLDAPYQARTLTVNDLEQQLPRARSNITQVGERLADKASQALDKTWVRDVPGARVVTASARVAKHAGRSQRQEMPRRAARVERPLRRLLKVEEGSFEDVAHFWYAQLPEGYRNAEGLMLVRHAQKEELDEIVSGRALEDLTERVRALQALAAEAETGSQAMGFLDDIEDVKLLITDLENRAQDVSASIAKLDVLIENAPPVNDEIIDALREVAADRRKILVRAGRLDPERAANREGLVSEWLGLEPDGTEIYMGHRLPPSVPLRATVAGVAAGTGRVTSPKGVGTRNRLVLASTGRLRPSTRVALEDWSAGQVFEVSNVARDHLGKLGSKFDNRYREGYTLINPKARTIPPHWRTEELAAFKEGADDIEEVREQAQDILRTFSARHRSDWDRLVEEAKAQGVKWDELRMVPNHLVDRYYSQFRSFRGRSTPGVAYDMAVDFFATSIVFARIGYIPKNVVQNLIISIPHQGAFLPINAARAAQVLADPELRYLLKAEVGFSGASQALASESARRGPTKWALGKIAGFVGSVADDPARISAFLHEAAAEGVISRVNPLLTEADRKALVRLLTEKKQRPRLNDIRSRSVDAMADFTRMTPDQARLARRFLIIPGWLMAGSRYPFHFAATHPIRSALMAYIALGEPGAPEELQFNNRVDTYFSGSDYLQGIDTPWGRERTASLLPVTTPFELGAGVVGSIEGTEGPFDFETPTVFDVANPAIATGVEWAKGEGELGRTAKRLLPGTYGLGKDLIAPPTNPPIYPEDVTRLGRLKREIGILPIEVIDAVDDDLLDANPRPGSGGSGGRAPRPGAGRQLAPRP